MAGRFFHHRLHPLTVDEVQSEFDTSDALKRLIEVGGFLEPFLSNSTTHARRWRRSHLDVILREDLLDLTAVKNIKSMEILVDLLRQRVGANTSMSALVEDLHVSVPTVKRWLEILEALYIVFPVRPWHRNIARALTKEPKYYFYDTGATENGPGGALENVVATALLKGLQQIEDTLGYHTSLHYIRNRDGKEVDFLVAIENKPVMMIEVKWKNDKLAPALRYFHERSSEIKALQIVYQTDRSKNYDDIRVEPAVQFLEQLPILLKSFIE